MSELRPPLIEIRDATVFRGVTKVFDHLDLVLEQGRSTAILGPNGAGKTNLLEAISYLVPGRGLRGAKLSDVCHYGSEAVVNRRGWAVVAQLSYDGKIIDIGTGLETGYSDSNRERRTIRIDGKNITIIGSSNLVGLPLSVMLLHRGATVTICNINMNRAKLPKK